MSQHFCRICGLYNLEAPWGEDNISPTHEICSCCGVENGYEDYTLESIREFRAQWINKGAIWFNKKRSHMAGI